MRLLHSESCSSHWTEASLYRPLDSTWVQPPGSTRAEGQLPLLGTAPGSWRPKPCPFCVCILQPLPVSGRPVSTVVNQNLSPETTVAYEVLRWGRLRENPGRLYYCIIFSQYLGGGSLRSQDFHRDSNFHKDLRTVDILNTSQGPSTPPSHPIPLLSGHCAVHCLLNWDPQPTPPGPALSSEVPRIVLQALWLSAGFGQQGAPAGWHWVERGAVYVSALHSPACLGGLDSCPGCSATAPAWPVLPFRPGVATPFCHSRSHGCPGPTHASVHAPFTLTPPEPCHLISARPCPGQMPTSEPICGCVGKRTLSGDSTGWINCCLSSWDARSWPWELLASYRLVNIRSILT